MRGRCVLVTGGTKGIGLATALAFARHGAEAVLTHRWGSADEDEIHRRFAEAGASRPLIVQADVSRTEDTMALMEVLKGRFAAVHVFISGAAGAVMVPDFDDLTERALLSTVRYSVWPLIEYLRAMRQTFGAYPRYVVVLSSTGPDRFAANYALVASAKAAVEALCRYLTQWLREDGVRINVLRTLGIQTESFQTAFGGEFADFMTRFCEAKRMPTLDDIAGTALALCSGLMDGVNGQTITVDRGLVFDDGIMRIYLERDRLGL